LDVCCEHTMLRIVGVCDMLTQRGKLVR
jgi:hypothetical protein